MNLCFVDYIQETVSSVRLVDRPSAEVFTCPGAAHITKKSLLKSPVETTEANEETWNSSALIRTIAVKSVQMFPMV